MYCRSEEVGVRKRKDPLEREANVFAAELLMPEDAVRTVWQGDIASAHAQLGVSDEAMRWRAYSFGLVTERPV